MRKPLVVGNWKMNGSLSFNQQLLEGLVTGLPALPELDMAVCVPAPYLAQVAQGLAATPVAWGAQNVSEYAAGAYTGEISVSMLKDFGCRYVLLGHSERRAIFAENDAQIAGKFRQAVTGGLIPVLCVGESQSERDAGQYAEVVQAQLAAVLHSAAGVGAEQFVVAYEPVWAIGTGRTATPGQAQEVHDLIRSCLAGFDVAWAEKVQVLYGGSIKPENAAELFGQPDIDGGLIGGASLNAKDFLAICSAAA